MNVSGSTENSDTKTPPKIAETVKTAKTLEREQANNIKDIVKYETGVTVVEAGRFGQSGFAIRGVDENRVAINIDGLRQAETLSSQGFKELFEGYGNFNNTRNGAEIETLKEVNITKGADSIKNGSGSLGGSVIYKTKDARDYLLNKDYYVSYKKGYATENNQSFNTLTLAGRYKKFDVLVVTTSRNGHELENYGYKNYNDKIQGKRREKADPYKIEQDSTLLKLSFNPTENHRFTFAADLYEHRSRGQDLSYTLKYQRSGNETDEVDSRHTNDKTKRRNISFSYENFSQTPFWDTLKLTYSDQRIKTRARTDEYCDAGVRDCEGTANPAGLKLTDGKITRRDGSDLKFKKNNDDDTYNSKTFIDTNEKEIESGIKRERYNEVWYDCSIFDCNNKIKAFGSKDRYGSMGEWKEFDIETKTLNGKKFARIKDSSNSSNSSYRTIYSIFPDSPGYLERLWQERDLDTNTQQLNLDLTKDFKTWHIEHNLQYGGSYNTAMKRMVNRAGYDAYDVQWWAQRTLGETYDYLQGKYIEETCANTSQWKANLCPAVDPEFSYLLPIKTTGKSVYLFDNFVITDYLSFDLGYRYDNIHYQPKYKHGITPKLPDDIVKGLFIPLNPSSNPDKVKENVQQNIDYIAKQNKKYKAHSYSFVSTIDPTSFLRLQLKYSKGFRTPTSDEMYFTFKHPDFTILPNTDLKPEIAKTKEIAFTLHNDDWGFISTSLFKTNYKNFIDLIFKEKRSFKVGKPGSQGETLPFSLYQNINRDNASLKGIEINSKVFLGKMAKFMDGFNLSYKYTYQKGRMDGNIPMNAIQPKTMVYGLGYDHPSQKFGFNFYTTHVASKNPEDTYDIYAEDKQQTDTSIKWRSKSYTILDLIGYVQPIKNLTIRAGVYNLTNRKYITWDSARSIRSFGTSNVIEQTTGLGINRFYAPGRNYKMSVQFEF
uniref:TonB-dependent hemoglobin/transferrin/lactoferrin family receptor n=1 Tax=Haemophilus influenzae TaxID=727 RepID=UPI00358F6008